jgi:hypothetical protein
MFVLPKWLCQQITQKNRRMTVAWPTVALETLLSFQGPSIDRSGDPVKMLGSARPTDQHLAIVSLVWEIDMGIKI